MKSNNLKQSLASMLKGREQKRAEEGQSVTEWRRKELQVNDSLKTSPSTSNRKLSVGERFPQEGLSDCTGTE